MATGAGDPGDRRGPPRRVQVHFDGACQPPRGGGVATYGFTVEGASLDHAEWGLAAPPGAPQATNNVAEYIAAIRALEWLQGRGYREEVWVIGDSQLVLRQMEGRYQIRANHLKVLHERLSELVRGFSRVEFVWVPRERNAHADELSKRALTEHWRASHVRRSDRGTRRG